MIPKYFETIGLKDIELLVVGPGGSGQSYFMKYIKRHVFANHQDDFDGLKHKGCPTKIDSSYKIGKCIFLYNDPLKAIHSHYRRKYQWENILKMGNLNNLKEKDVDTFKKYLDLTNKEKRDLFGMEYQFLNWVQKEKSYEIYFLDFNDIMDKKEELCNYLKIKNTSFDNFEIRKRAKKPNETFYFTKYPNVLKVYNDLYEKMKNISKEENKKVKINSPYEIKKGIIIRRKQLKLFSSMVPTNIKDKYVCK
jgi:hypothetical protein